MNAIMYNYFRYPATVYSVTIIHIAYSMSLTPAASIIIVYYIIFIIFMNGSFYNKLTIENHLHHLVARKLHSLNNIK